MVGRAVLTTEMSRTTRIWAVRARARTAQDRRVASAGSGPDGGVCGPGWCSGCVGPLIAAGTEPVVGAGSVRLTGAPRGRAAVAAAGACGAGAGSVRQGCSGADGLDDVVDRTGGAAGAAFLAQQALVRGFG